MTSSAANEKSNLLTLLNDQVDAFNKQNINRLVENVSDDFIWYSLTSDELLIETKGKEAFRQSMNSYYQLRKAGQSHSTIESYSIQGKRISFNERVSHLDKNGKIQSASATGIYQIENGKITRAWYFID